MARDVGARIRVAATLEATSPIHVGGFGAHADTDLPLAVDGAGRIFVPGTSLTGPLRAWTRRSDPDLANWMWGHEDAERGSASWVSVEDSVVEAGAGSDADDVEVELLEGVGIDRVTGAAHPRIKYDRAVVPRGSRIPLDVTLSLPPILGDDDTSPPSSLARRAPAVLARLLEALARQEIRLGAARTRGLGKLKLMEAAVYEQDLRTKAGVLRALRNQDAGIPWADWAQRQRGFVPKARAALDITIRWRPDGPCLSKAEADGIEVDHLPLVTARGDGLTFVMPWSGIKGVLRSRAEMIVRTVLGISCPGNPPSQEPGSRGFIDQVDVPLIRDVFGTAKPSKRSRGASGGSRPTAPKPGLGAIHGDDALASACFTHDQWRAVERATNPTELQRALGQLHLSPGTLDAAFHVALDRFTGGAAENLLFSVLEPHDLSWHPLAFTLDFERIEPARRCVAAYLVLLLCRELLRGELAFGFATHRGLGSLRIDEIVLAGAIPIDGHVTPIEASLTEPTLAGLDAALKGHLTQAWRDWCAAESSNEALPERVVGGDRP